MVASGNKPPMSVPKKGSYMVSSRSSRAFSSDSRSSQSIDLKRTAEYYKRKTAGPQTVSEADLLAVYVVSPDNFPPNTSEACCYFRAWLRTLIISVQSYACL